VEIVTKIAPICLALIMLGLGLGLSVKDFTRVLSAPKDFFVGFFSQLVILPIVALAIAIILDLSTPIAVGLMIIAAAPGGVTSNVLTKFAEGDVALSISLTAVISLISIISVPFIVINSAEFLGLVISKDISITGIALKMALVVTVPVIIGMIIRAFAENFISSKINIINKLTGWLFVIVFAAIWIEEKDNILNYLAQAGLAVLILNISMMMLAYFIAKKFVSGIAQQKCIALECGLQNGTLAVFVATLMFDDITYMIPTAAYALIMYITGFIFIYILRKSNQNL
jgi:BASS family bile acid:Na+ symporter